MSDHGSSFGTATVLAQPTDYQTGIVEFLGDEDFFTFSITNATNVVVVIYQDLPDPNNSNPAGQALIDLHDGTFTLVTPTSFQNSDSYTQRLYVNLPVDTYYAKLYRSINVAYRRYLFSSWVWENNVFVDNHTTDEAIELYTKSIAFDSSIINNGNMFQLCPTVPKRTNHWIHNVDITEKYQVSGTVYQDGGTVAGRLLRLYDRTTGELIGETTSDVGGAYNFDTLLFSDAKYYVVAFDDGVPDLQAKVRDYLTPKTIAL